MIMDLILLISLVLCAREGSMKERWLTIDIMKVLGVGGAHGHTSCVVVNVGTKRSLKNQIQKVKEYAGRSRPH